MERTSHNGRTELTRLDAFVDAFPYTRRPILRLVRLASRLLPPGSRVLDAGCGDAPFRSLFKHCQYITADFAATEYHDFSACNVDIVCDLKNIPLDDRSLDAILCTEVLEHVPEPAQVLTEFHRLLVPEGHLFLSVPLLWEVHEAPYDFYRYTPFALDRLLCQAGFSIDFIRPHGGVFWTVAQFVDSVGLALHPRYVDLVPVKVPLPTPVQQVVHKSLSSCLRRVIAPGLASLDRLDANKAFTMGYAVHCTVPLNE